jgi:hypothetical protein
MDIAGVLGGIIADAVKKQRKFRKNLEKIYRIKAKVNRIFNDFELNCDRGKE